jgi:hypothetical protein
LTHSTVWCYFAFISLFQIVILTNSHFGQTGFDPPISGYGPALDHWAIHVLEGREVKLKHKSNSVIVRILVQKCHRRKYDLRYIAFTVRSLSGIMFQDENQIVAPPVMPKGRGGGRTQNLMIILKILRKSYLYSIFFRKFSMNSMICNE